MELYSLRTGIILAVIWIAICSTIGLLINVEYSSNEYGYLFIMGTCGSIILLFMSKGDVFEV